MVAAYLASSLHSEVVLLIGSPFEDSALSVHFPALALSSAHNHINSVCLMRLDAAFLNLVSWHILVGDDLGSVDGESLDLVRDNTVDSLAAESINSLLDQGSDLIVLLACKSHANSKTQNVCSHFTRKKTKITFSTLYACSSCRNHKDVCIRV
jgi:hypothetical protein